MTKPQTNDGMVTPEEWLRFADAHGLSNRELTVLGLICRSRTHKAIARQLRLGQGTVNRYCYRLHQKLGVKDNVALVFKLMQFVLHCRQESNASAKTPRRPSRKRKRP
jgi:DNA-binding CsgD family transcriptional regulator